MMKRKAKVVADASVSEVVEKEVKEVKREWRQFLRFKDENRLLFASFIVVLTAIVVINTLYIVNYTNRGTDDGTVATQPNPNLVLTSLQTGTNHAVQARVSNVSENSKRDYAFTIDPSDTMLTMDISITNLTSVTQQVLPSNQLYVRSNEGDYAPLHPSMYLTNALAATDVQPGQTVKGQISFDVPQRVASPLLYVDTGWGGYAPLVFDVLH